MKASHKSATKIWHLKSSELEFIIRGLTESRSSQVHLKLSKTRMEKLRHNFGEWKIPSNFKKYLAATGYGLSFHARRMLSAALGHERDFLERRAHHKMVRRVEKAAERSSRLQKLRNEQQTLFDELQRSQRQVPCSSVSQPLTERPQ